MMTKFTWTLILSLLVCFNQSYAVCELLEEGQDRFTLKTEKSLITVLGWEHIVYEEATDLLKGLLSFTDSKDSCAAIDVSLQSLVKENIEFFTDYGKNYQLLTAQMLEIPYHFMAVEQTPEQHESHKEGDIKLITLLTPLTNRCPDLKSKFEAILKVFKGPDHVLAAERGMNILPTESEKLKLENELDFEEDKLDRFDFDNPAITSDGVLAIKEIRKEIFKLKYPNQKLIDRVISFETNLTIKKYLRIDLEYALQKALRKIQGAYRRNSFMASKLLMAEASVIYPIGVLHVNDLRNQMLQMCK